MRVVSFDIDFALFLPLTCLPFSFLFLFLFFSFLAIFPHRVKLMMVVPVVVVVMLPSFSVRSPLVKVIITEW